MHTVPETPLLEAELLTEPFPSDRKKRRRIQRASSQTGPGPAGLPWVEPRIPFDDLLYFYDTNVWHRRCVLAKAMLVGGLGYAVEVAGEVLYDPAQGIDRLPEHPVVRLLRHPNPNPLEPFETLLFRVLVDTYALGNGYFEVARDPAGRPAELYHVPARTVRRDGGLQGYWQVKHGARTRFNHFGDASGRNELLPLALYDPSGDYYGAPDWLAALGPMGLDRTILEFNTRLFANSMMAHLAVIVEGGKLSPAGRDALRSFVREQAVGVGNAGRVLLLEDERERVRVRFEKLNLEIKDLLIVEAQKHFRDVVIGAHGVPPRVLGIVTAGQLGASGEVEGQLRTFRETVLRPGRRLVETALAAVTAELDPDARIVLKEIDTTDVRADADFYARLIDRGVFDPHEVRALLERA